MFIKNFGDTYTYKHRYQINQTVPGRIRVSLMDYTNHSRLLTRIKVRFDESEQVNQ